MPTERQVQRATEIIRDFVSWDLATGPCPIDVNDRHWFKKLCAMAERQAILEDELGLLVTESEKVAEVKAQRQWLIQEWITFGPAGLLLFGMGAWNILISMGKLPVVIPYPYAAMLMIGAPFVWMFPWIMYNAHKSEKNLAEAKLRAKLGKFQV